MGSQAFETCPSLCCRAAPVSCLTTSLTIFSQAVQKIVPALLHSTLLLSNRLWEASCMAPCLLIPLAWKERSGRPASLLPFAALFLVAPNKVVSLASTCIFLILFPPPLLYIFHHQLRHLLWYHPHCLCSFDRSPCPVSIIQPLQNLFN